MLAKSLYLKLKAASPIGAFRQTRNFSWTLQRSRFLYLTYLDKHLLNTVTALINTSLFKRGAT